jgi:hypothetical protein
MISFWKIRSTCQHVRAAYEEIQTNEIHQQLSAYMALKMKHADGHNHYVSLLFVSYGHIRKARWNMEENEKSFPECLVSVSARGHTSGKVSNDAHTTAALSLSKASRINRTWRPATAALAGSARGIQMNLRETLLSRVNRDFHLRLTTHYANRIETTTLF